MAFPADPLKIVTELRIDGAWQDISADVFNRNPVVITRGKQDEGAAVDPGSCRLTLNNGRSRIAGMLGRYSPRNPRSDLFGKFGRNTQMRVSVFEGGEALFVDDGVINGASTPDNAALDITGDIDLRWEGEGDWYKAGAQMLMGKWGAPGQRSYHMRIENQQLYIHTTQDGTAGRFVALTLPPSLPKRCAFRATMDVNNGLGGYTTALFWSESIDEPWHAFGPDVVNTTFGPITLFSSTAPLSISPEQTDLGITVLRRPFEGRVYRAEVRSGINGAVVASPNFEAQTSGTTGFTDSAGRVWSVASGAELSNRRVRFVGEVSEWPTRWNEDGSDSYVPVVASGLLRRLTQGKKALDSSLRRRVPSFGPLAYWPLEGGIDTTTAENLGLEGGSSLSLTPADWASADTLPSSNPLPTLDTSNSEVPCHLFGSIAPPEGAITGWSIQYVYRNDSPNVTLNTYMRVLSTGTVSQWFIQQSDGQSKLLGLDSEGVEVFSNLIGTGSDLYNQWVRVELKAEQEGGNVRYTITWTDVGGTSGFFDDTFAGTIGRPTAVASPVNGYSGNLNGMAIGHISAWGVGHTDAYERAVDGWAGETAGERMNRLSGEESFPLVTGDLTANHSRVGPQYPQTMLDVLQDSADVDGGILAEQRENVGLIYRGRAGFYNQRETLALDFNARGLVTPIEPVDDDQLIRNDRTIERLNGGSARAVLDEGPLSVQEPPNGVGMYDDSTTLNLFNDAQAIQTAFWYLRLGTVDEARYPRIMINLAVRPDIIDAATRMDVGDRLTIVNPPEWLPPDTIDQQAQGYTETLELTRWFIEFNCAPNSVFQVANVDGTPVNGAAKFIRADTAGSVTAAPMTDTSTLLTVRTTKGPIWTSDQFDSPYDLRVAGEIMTVTAPGNLLNTNPFFDTDIAGWSAQGSTLAWSTTFVHPNPRARGSLRVTPNGGAAANAVATSPGVAVSPGVSYVSGVWVYAPNGYSNVRAVVNWHDAAATYLSTSSATVHIIPAGVWTFIKQTQTAPANAAFGRLVVGAGGTPTAADVTYYWAARLTRTTAGFLDTFTRTVSNGWGQSDTGDNWSSVIAPASDYSVSGGVGRHTHPVTNTPRTSLIPSPAADLDLMTDVGATVNPAGAAFVGSLLARAVDDGNWYAAGISLNPGGAVQVQLSKRFNFNGGVALSSPVTIPATFTAGVFIRFRFQIFGSTLRVKGWRVGDPEPDWQITATDTQFTAAANLGLRSFRGTGNTNTGASILLDNFQLLDTQRFTVERAVNGVVKSHDVAGDTRLAYPARVAF